MTQFWDKLLISNCCKYLSLKQLYEGGWSRREPGVALWLRSELWRPSWPFSGEHWLRGASGNGSSFSTRSLKRGGSWWTGKSFYLIMAWARTSKKIVLSGVGLRWKVQWENSFNVGGRAAHFLSEWVEHAFSLHVFLAGSHNPQRGLSAFGLGLPTNDKQWQSMWQAATGGQNRQKLCAS